MASWISKLDSKESANRFLASMFGKKDALLLRMAAGFSRALDEQKYAATQVAPLLVRAERHLKEAMRLIDEALTPKEPSLFARADGDRRVARAAKIIPAEERERLAKLTNLVGAHAKLLSNTESADTRRADFLAAGRLSPQARLIAVVLHFQERGDLRQVSALEMAALAVAAGLDDPTSNASQAQEETRKTNYKSAIKEARKNPRPVGGAVEQMRQAPSFHAAMSAVETAGEI